jgi:glycosyltransferase involved in cell wall biosynthesis
MLSRRAEVVLVNAPAVAAAVFTSGGARREQIRCIPYGVDTERFRPRGEIADLGEGAVVLGVGRLVAEKGFGDLVAAAATMSRRPRVAVLGEGPLAGELRELAGRLGVDLVLLGGVDNVVPYLRRADAVAFPSRCEGVPNAMLEALAVARPVVATTTGGIPDVVRDAEHALLVPPADHHALATALERVLGTEDTGMGSRGRVIVTEHHSWRQHIGMRRLLYESLARPHARCRASCLTYAT